MSRVKKLLRELSWDNWTLLLCGIAAVVIGVLDFTQLVTVSAEVALRLLIIATGLIMGAIVAQTSRRAAEINDLRDALQSTSTELISNERDFDLHLVRNLKCTRNFILDTTLNAERATVTHPSDLPACTYRTIFELVTRKGISYKRIDVIHNKERLEFVISRLLIHEGTEYYIRYFDPPPKAIPVLNMLSIDNERFYLGGFYNTTDAPIDSVHALFIVNPQVRELLEAYWNNLWYSAKPLNEGLRINWDELRSVAERLGMSSEEFDTMIAKWKQETDRHKRRSRHTT